MVTQVFYGGLTSVEQSLVEHVGRGEWLDLAAGDEAADEAAMRSWGDSRTCRASVIRDILRGRLAADPDPHGLRLRGARIAGRLDLENLATDVNLELKDCLLEEGVLAQHARLAFVGLAGCQLEHPAEPPLDGTRLTCSVLTLTRARVIGHASTGAVRLTGAHIGGNLDCTGAELGNDSGPALSAERLQVGQGIFLREGFTATGSGDDGAVRLLGAHVGGNLNCTGAELRNDSGPALHADGLQVDQRMFLRGGFTATGSGDGGAVNMLGARIVGQLDCTGAKLRNDSGPALHADSLQVDQGMFLTGGFTATGSGGYGAVNLAGARIGRSLYCDGASVRNDSGPALLADGLQVGQDVQCDRLTADGGVVLGGHIGRLLSFEGAALNNRGGFALLSDGLRVDGTMFCRNGFTAQGEVRLPGARIGGRLYFDGAKLSNPGGRALVASRLTVGQDMFCRNRGVPEHEQPFVVEGAVILAGAHIGGHFVCDGAQLRNDSGSALHADSLQVDQDMLLTDGFTATGGGDFGAVRLSGAHIGGSLEGDGAQLRNDSGPALYADRLQVDQSMFLRYGFTATGSSGYGAVYLVGAHIGGHLDCTDAELRNEKGPALAAYSLRVGEGMYLTGGFTATGGGEDVAVDLTDARVGGAFLFAPPGAEHKVKSHRLAVDGLTYRGVPRPISAQGWREQLRHGTARYAAQPYQQLAAGYLARGDDRQARQTLMAQRDDQLARTRTRWPERWWGKITKVTLGYGYQPWRAVWFLAGVVAVSCVLAVVLGAHGALAQTSKTAAPGRSCTVVQQVSVGLDLNLPVGTSVARAACDLTTDPASAAGVWLTAVGWVLRVLAWVFAALFIAGFTSAVRKT